ncbi:alkaline phosphatase [Bacteroidia bacterium]|nr:alkaline phosphatase [Bacteroidia bacterium]
MKKLSSLFLVIIFVFASSFTPKAEKKQKIENNPDRPTNVILLIGDGMGLGHVFTLISMHDSTAFQRFHFFGFSRTQSANKFTTDSGAGGTAIATGKKTNNNYISVTPDGIAMETLVETGNKNAVETGVVVACGITHATPASFLAHNENRNNYEQIAESILNTHPTLMIGGGKKHFENRKDKRNLSDSLRKQGFNVLYDFNDVLNSENPKMAALLFEDHPLSMQNGRGNYLKPASEKAIELLNKSGKGFFLMIEGSQIDWEAHANNTIGLIQEMEDFNAVVNAVLDFAEKDGHTLVVVTADHETGGLVPMDKVEDYAYATATTQWTCFDHTPCMVPVYAFGPGAKEFAGIYHNTEIHHKIVKIMGW